MFLQARQGNREGVGAKKPGMSFETQKTKLFGRISRFLPGFLRLEIPQGELAATNFYDSGGSRGEELGEELGESLAEIFWAF